MIRWLQLGQQSGRDKPEGMLVRSHFPSRSLLPFLIGSVVLPACMISCGVLWSQQTTIILNNGMRLGPGRTGETSGLDQSAFSPQRVAGAEPKAKPITLLDDQLRLTFFHTRTIANESVGGGEPLTIVLPNAARRATKGKIMAGLLRTLQVTPFDDFGRRIYTVTTPSGPLTILQGITEVTAQSVRVESLQTENAVIWDMRLALSSIPSDRLKQILITNIDRRDPQQWLDVVNLLREATRYSDAKEVLMEAMQTLPELEVHRDQVGLLDQQLADQLFEEVQLRRQSGQERLAEALLRGFDPRTLADETKLKIERRILESQALEEQDRQTIGAISEDVKKLEDPQVQASLEDWVSEVSDHLNSATRDRLADYLRLRDDATLSAEQRLALAVGGWVLGAGAGIEDLGLASSLLEARPLVSKYLQSGLSEQERSDVLSSIRKLEAGVPRYIAPMLALLLPPDPLPQPLEEHPLRHAVTAKTPLFSDEQSPGYLIQLPPAYDPYRSYPCILAIHGQFTDASAELDWWAGRYSTEWKMAIGEAARHGFIVVAPQWRREDQFEYEATEEEHARLLVCLRDAMRRSSIDADRIFVAGHHMGGEAAWDLALAHPDLWAGAVVVAANKNPFIQHYATRNSRYVPLYYVTGSIDGVPAPLARNGDVLDQYVQSSRNDFLMTLYTGRGRDHFQEELPRIMEWLKVASHVRPAAPEELTLKTARPGDRFFWWLETGDFPPEKMNHPLLPFDAKRVVEIEASRKPLTNLFTIGTLPARGYTLWLEPGSFDFDKKIVILDRGKRTTQEVRPDLQLLLEDARMRADRKRPFWAKLEIP